MRRYARVSPPVKYKGWLQLYRRINETSLAPLLRLYDGREGNEGEFYAAEVGYRHGD